MKCPTTDKLSQYVDHLLARQEQLEIDKHVTTCFECERVIASFKAEQQFIEETLQTPTLPDHFAATVLEHLQPYEQKSPHKKWSSPRKKILLSAAGLILAFGLTVTMNQSFAEWIGGLFGTGQVDDGLRLAADAGLINKVDYEVENKGIIFKIGEIVADSSRVALSFQVLDENGKLDNAKINMENIENNIIAVDQNGVALDNIRLDWWEGSEYGLVEFSLREQDELEKITIKFDLVELNGKEGSWKLEVPVELKDSNKFTKTIPLHDAEKSVNGVFIKLKKFQIVPSSNEFHYETAFTKDELARIEKEIKKLEENFGKDTVTGKSSFTNYGTAIGYHIENEEEKVVYNYNRFFEGIAYPTSTGILQSTSNDMKQLGQYAWNESFIPQKNKQKLSFVLDGVFKTVPTDYSIKINVNKLKKSPVSFEYAGNKITIKKAKLHNEYSFKKSLNPIETETAFKIEMEGSKEGTAPLLGTWILVDDKGKAYPTYGSSSLLNEKDENGRFLTTNELKIYDLNEVPEEFTLHLISITQYEEISDKWKVPLY